MTGLLWLLLANAGVLLGARRLLSRFGTGQPALDAALFLLFRLILISAAVLLAGSLGILRPWVLGVAGAVAAAALIARGTHREFLPLWRISHGPAIYLLAALAVRLLFHAWALAPYLGDVTSYHLPKVAEWVVHGSLFTDLGPDRRAWFPAGFELVETWWVVFLHHDVLIELAGIEFLALGAAATAALASRLGLSGPAGLLAGTIYAAVPGMMIQSVSAINDAAAAAMVVTAAALLLSRAHPGLVVASLAFGIGIKPTVGFAIPGLILLRILPGGSSGVDRPSPRPDRALWMVAALAVVIGSVWYVRNAVVFGNPIYPAATSSFDFGEKKMLRTVGPRTVNLVRNLDDLVDESILDRKRALNGMLEFIAGWGVVPFGFGLVGLLAACRASREWRRVAVCFGVSLISVLALAENDDWVLRFILFFPALLSAAAVWLATDVKLLLRPLVLLTGLTLAGTLFTEDIPRAAMLRATSSGWRERTYAPPFFAEVRAPRVGCYGDVAPMSYLLYRPDFSREVVYLRPTSSTDLLDLMKRHDLTVLYAQSLYDRNGFQALLDGCVRSGRLRRIHDRWFVRVPE